eukprot:1602629-Ditylum_brightwellii.AAC.1
MASQAVPTVEETTTIFPQPTILTMSGQSICDEINTIHKMLMGNISLINTDLGGGAHGLIELVVAAHQHQQLTISIFTPPVHSGTNPPIMHPFMLAHKLEAPKEHYHCSLHQYKTCMNMDKALKTQLCFAFDDQYTNTMREVMMVHSNRITTDALYNLYGTYGQIVSTMLTHASNKMRKPFNTGVLIEEFFSQLIDMQNTHSLGGHSNTTH